MATQQQKFSGNNILNNNVIVNYKKKTIDFTAAKGDSNLQSIALSVIGAWQANTYIFALVYIVGISLGLQVTPGYWIVLSTISIAQCSLYPGKKFRKEGFPKFNYGNIMITNFFIKKKRTLNPDAIVKNMYVLPSFSNVMVEYKTTGEFSRYLSRVEIQQKYLESPYNFQAAFIFTKKPTRGEMRITYV